LDREKLNKFNLFLGRIYRHLKTNPSTSHEMLKSVLSLVLVLCVGLLAAWFCNPAWRQTIESLSTVFSLVASIAALTVFAQFYVTFSQATEAAAEKERVARALLVSRITALSAEIIANIQLCNLFESEQTQYQSGNVVPSMKFRYLVASDLIRSGEITHHKLRAELTSLLMQMEVLNSVIERSAYQMNFRGAFGPTGLESINNSLSAAVHLVLSKAPAIREQLVATQPLIEEFFQDPNKYANEAYLREKLVSEGQIR